jgi:hypothetical protein
MQNIIRHKFTLIVSIALLAIPFLGSYTFPYKIWDRMMMIFPMFILFYGESFPFSILIGLFITLPIYIFGIFGLMAFLLSKGKYKFPLKAMLFIYLAFFMLFGAIGVASLLSACFLNNTKAIDADSIVLILAAFLWGLLTYKAVIKLDRYDNQALLTNLMK